MSAARSAFLNGIQALRDACAEPAVIAGSPTGQFLRRGLTVAAFNLLETFIADRWKELATHINGGHVQFLDLPERLQKRAISRTIAIARDRTRRSGLDLADLRSLSQQTGESLAAVTANLRISAFTWLWEGSNISADDFAASLSFIHVGKAFESVRILSGRLGFPNQNATGGPADLKGEFAALASERHKCAHEASYSVTSLWLRAMPDRLVKFASCTDIFSSVGADYLRLGHRPFLEDDQWVTPARVNLRFVRERPKDFAEYVEGRSKASHVSSDGEALFREACGRAGPREVVVRQDLSGICREWFVESVS